MENKSYVSKLRVVGTGNPATTKVYINDVLIPNVIAIQFGMTVDDIVTDVVLTFCGLELDIDLDEAHITEQVLED